MFENIKTIDKILALSVRSLLGISVAALDEEHVFVGALLYFRDKHLHKVWCTHASSGTDLAIQCAAKFLCLLVEGKY